MRARCIVGDVFLCSYEHVEKYPIVSNQLEEGKRNAEPAEHDQFN